MMDTFSYAETHIGRRAHNEDWYGISEDVGLFVVADGMGGYDGGEVASRIAVTAVDAFYRDADLGASSETDDLFLKKSRMDTAFRLANLEVRRHRHGRFSKMGSTLSAMLIEEDRALIGHVGDSRVYRFRRGRLRQLTADHSLVMALKNAGMSDVIVSRLGHIITRAIGVHESTAPDIVIERVLPGDRFLLCTDGLTDVVQDEVIEAVMRDVPVCDVCSTLVREALKRGGDDNITALLVEVVDDAPTVREFAAAL